MSTLEQKITLLQWLSGILIVLLLVTFGLYTNKGIEFKTNYGFYQDDIAGSYG